MAIGGVSSSGDLHLGATLQEIAVSERDAWDGRVSDRPFVLLSQPTSVDASRAPAGRMWPGPIVTCRLRSPIDMLPRIEQQIERFAPGFRDRVLARSVMSPADIERHNENFVGGDIASGVVDLWQLFTRPTWRNYSTPIAGCTCAPLQRLRGLAFMGCVATMPHSVRFVKSCRELAGEHAEHAERLTGNPKIICASAASSAANGFVVAAVCRARPQPIAMDPSDPLMRSKLSSNTRDWSTDFNQQRHPARIDTLPYAKPVIKSAIRTSVKSLAATGQLTDELREYLETAYISLAEYLEGELVELMTLYRNSAEQLAAEGQLARDKTRTSAWQTLAESGSLAGEVARAQPPKPRRSARSFKAS